EPPLLLCQRVSKWYGPVIGVNQVTLELRSGITGLVGANGAGKSTLMRLITGHLRPDLGQVTIRGIDSWSSQAKRLIGYCPSADAFYEEMSGRQFVEAMARLCGFSGSVARQRAEQALERVGMADRCDRRVRGYSKGMRQRVKLAQALLTDPRLLVLDEPLSGIDPVGRAELIDLFRGLADEGRALVISSHALEELDKRADHVAILVRGRIAAIGSVAQIRERLDNHPLSIRIELKKDDNAPNGDRSREVARALLALPEVVGVDLIEEDMARDAGATGLIVRAKNPRAFFQALGRLVTEEWFEVCRLETVDDSAQAVLGYLLGAKQ